MAGRGRGRVLAAEREAADGFALEGVVRVQVLTRCVEVRVPHEYQLAKTLANAEENKNLAERGGFEPPTPVLPV